MVPKVGIHQNFEAEWPELEKAFREQFREAQAGKCVAVYERRPRR